MTPANPEKTKRLVVSLPVELATRVEALAEADRRSVSAWCALAIELEAERMDAMTEQGMGLRDRLDDQASRFKQPDLAR